MTTPIWFLDINGVVNAVGPDPPDHLTRTDATTAGTTWPIHYSPDVIDAINLIHRNGLAEVRWLTTWGPDARTSFAPAVGLDDFAAYEMNDSKDWWKAAIVAASLPAERRPAIWTDDEMTAALAARVSDSTDLPTLLIAPVENVGLVSGDLRSVTNFCTIVTSVFSKVSINLPGQHTNDETGLHDGQDGERNLRGGTEPRTDHLSHLPGDR